MNRTELQVEEMEQVNAGCFFFAENLEEKTSDGTNQASMMTASIVL